MGRATWRVALLAVVFVVAAAVLFGPQLVGFWLSLKPVAIGVHNATGAPLTVSAVHPGGDRAFYRVGPSDTRLIPDSPDEVITILDAGCRILDARTRGHQPPALLVVDVSATGTVWRAAPMPPIQASIPPADAAPPCSVQP
jgi:hypothetical protein